MPHEYMHIQKFRSSRSYIAHQFRSQEKKVQIFIGVQVFRVSDMRNVKAANNMGAIYKFGTGKIRVEPLDDVDVN